MGVKISELPEAQESNNNDLFVVVQGSTTKKVTKELILQVIANQLLNIYTKEEADDLLDLKTDQTDFEILQENSGNKIELSLNTSNYVLKATLKNSNNVILNESTIDLPIESAIVNGRYDDVSKKLILTLQNGNTIEIPLGDLISGLVTQEDFEESQETQNEKITDLEKEVDVLSEIVNSELEDGTATGDSITVNDSARAKAKLDIEGNIKQATTEGYQLFDKDNAIIKSMNTAGSPSIFSAAANQKHVYIQCKPNTTYTVQKDISDVAVLGIYETEQEPAVGVTYKSLYFSSTSNGVVTVTTGENVNYLDVRLNTGSMSSEVQQKILDSLLIYEGNEVKPYEPYTGGQSSPSPEYPQDIQVVKGNNEIKIFNKNWITGNKTNTNRGITTTLNNNILTVQGTTAGNWWTGIEVNTNIPKGDWTVSIQKALPFTLNFILTLEDGTTKNLSIAKGNLAANGSISSNAIKYNINFASAETGATYDETIELQLEKGSQTEYEIHKGQSYPITLPEGMEMCKIGDYADTFENVDGKWYKNKKINKGSTELFINPRVVTSTIGTDLFAIAINVNNINTTISDKGSVISNILSPKVVGAQTDISNPNNGRFYQGIAKSSGNNQIMISIEKKYLQDVTTQDTIDFLNNNNFEFYFILNTSVLEEITDTTLIEQLNALLDVMSYYGQTNVIVEAEDISPIMTLNYKKSNRILRNEIDTIKARLDLLES